MYLCRSILGHLLLLIFINDLIFSIRYASTFHFENNTSFLKIKSTIKEINKYVNRDLGSLSKCLNANKISLNFSKAKALIFKRHLKLKLCIKKLFTSNSIKDLGVISDKFLQRNFQINQLYFKLDKANPMLCKIPHYLYKTTLRSIYYATFLSHL